MRFVLALAASLAAPLAFASVHAEAADPKDKKPDESSHYVNISPVAIPVIVSGKVVNYVFVTVRLDLMPRADGTKMREKEPYFRDALVKAAHRTPFTLSTDYTKIDETKLKSAVLRDAAAIAGPGAIKGVNIMSQAPKSLRVRPR